MKEQQTTVATTARGKYLKVRAMREAQSVEDKRLGKFMAAIREGTGMSQRELAKHMCVQPSWVGKNELAHRGVSVEGFIKWAHGVNKNASELLGQFIAEHPDAQSGEGATPGSDPQGSC